MAIARLIYFRSRLLLSAFNDCCLISEASLFSGLGGPYVIVQCFQM